MRKKQPNDVLAAFKADLDASLDLWRDLRELTGEQGDLAKRVSLGAFTRAAASTEASLSDWFIAAVNRDATAFKTDLASRVEQSVAAKWPALDQKVAIDLPKHPDLDLVAKLLDPKSRNVTFADFDDFDDRATRQLSDPYRSAVLAVPGHLREALLAVHKIRNVIAHGSPHASNEMNDTLEHLNDQRLRRGTRRVQPGGLGNHLNADVGGQRRVELYHTLMRDLADALVC